MTAHSLAFTAVVVPPVAGLLVVAPFLMAEQVHMNPWSRVEVTVAEAAVGGSVARALALIRSGHDPNQPSLVPAGLLDSRAYMVDAIDAAILGRHAEFIPVLEAHGAKVGDVRRAGCFALAVDVPEALPMIGMTDNHQRRDKSIDWTDAVTACLASSTEQ